MIISLFSFARYFSFLFVFFFLYFCIFVVSSSSNSAIAIVVNGIPITSNDLSRRISLLRLRNITGDLDSKAREELIIESLQSQEGSRLGISIPDADIDASYRKFATDNNLAHFSLDNLLEESGVSVRGFKSYIRAGLLWQRLVSLRYQAEFRSSEATNLSYIFGGENEEATQTTQYTLKHIIFVVPDDKRSSQLEGRLSQANNFRNRYTDCDSIISAAKDYKDVSVLDRGRVLETRIPDRWLSEIRAKRSGGITRALRTDRGVELYAVCDTQEIRSSTNFDRRTLFPADTDVGAELSKLSDKYLSELRDIATIQEN